MEKIDNLFTGQETRERLMRGVQKAAAVIGGTMGTAGANGLIQTIERPYHLPTNDGIMLLESMNFADPLEEMGRQILLEAVSRSNKQSGDGSSTATVVCASILEKGQEVKGVVSPLEIKKSLERCLPFIEESIKKQIKEIGIDEVGSVASISAEDPEIGSLIQEIYSKIGKDGVIQWDISKSPNDTYEIGNGLRIFDAGYATPYMCDADAKGRFLKEANLIQPLVLLARKKLSTHELDPVLERAFNMGFRQLVIFCDEMDVNLLGDLLQLQMKNGFRTVVVRMPVVWKGEWWEDLAISSGGKIIDGVSPNVAFEKLGKFERIKVMKDETIVEGTQDLSQHILALKVDGSDEALQRAERLNVKTARYFVGAPSDSALAYRRLKVEDAINASSCALEHGIVAGGGVALLNAIEELPEEEIGAKILSDALRSPTRHIVKNALPDKGAGEIEILISKLGGKKGFNSKTGQIEKDMFEAQIVDASDVALNAIRNALSVAATILTIDSVITFPQLERSPMVPQNHV